MKDKIPTYINIMLDTLSTNLKDAVWYNEMHSLYWEQTMRHRNSKYVLIIDLYISKQCHVIETDPGAEVCKDSQRPILIKFPINLINIVSFNSKINQLIIL